MALARGLASPLFDNNHLDDDNNDTDDDDDNASDKIDHANNDLDDADERSKSKRKMVPLNRSGFAPIMRMALKLMRMTMIATTLKYEDNLDDSGC